MKIKELAEHLENFATWQDVVVMDAELVYEPHFSLVTINGKQVVAITMERLLGTSDVTDSSGNIINVGTFGRKNEN